MVYVRYSWPNMEKPFDRAEDTVPRVGDEIQFEPEGGVFTVKRVIWKAYGIDTGADVYLRPPISGGGN